MRKHIFLAVLFSFAAIQTAPPVFAQDEQPATPPVKEAEATTAEEPKSSASQEVEINEDTYRQFMELKDANQQRDIIPEETFKPGSGLQKLEKLPEESQKHLRNELREIIVGGDPWQPGDEDADYPYVPSNAARTDPSLQKQELEAWGELVDSYNQREAQIYANKAGNRATMSPEDGAGEMPGQGSMQNGESGQDKEGAQGSQNSATAESDQTDTAGTYSPGAANDPNAQSTSGVSQNAMEFLQGLGKNGGNAREESAGTPAQNTGQPGSPASVGERGQSSVQAGQQASAKQGSRNTGETQLPATDMQSSEAGASQNALEFLQGTAGQSRNTGEGSGGSSAANANQSPGGQASSGDALAQDQAGQNQGQQEGQAGTQGDGQADGQSKAEETGRGNAQAAAQGDQQADSKDNGETGEQGEGQAQDGQQSETVEKSVTITPPAESSAALSAQPEEESTAGASQNALEYLKGENAGAGQAADGDADADPPPEGTLNIQDLLNAQGVSGSTGTNPEPPVPDDENPSDETKPDKDGGG